MLQDETTVKTIEAVNKNSSWTKFSWSSFMIFRISLNILRATPSKIPHRSIFFHLAYNALQNWIIDLKIAESRIQNKYLKISKIFFSKFSSLDLNFRSHLCGWCKWSFFLNPRLPPGEADNCIQYLKDQINIILIIN